MKNITGKHNNKLTGARWLILAGFLTASLCAGPAFAENSSPAKAEPSAKMEPSATISTDSASSVSAAPNSAAAAAPAAVSAYKPALTPVSKTSTTSQLANLIGGLALILVLIYGLSWFVKRFTQGGFMQNSSIKMLASLPLGTRERLMLVEVGGKQILLGVTAAQINSLYVFDEPVVPASANADKSTVPTASDFSQKLMAILQQKNSGKADSSPHKNIK